MTWVSNGANLAAIDSLKIEHEDLTPWARQCRDYNRSQKCNHLKGGRVRSSSMKDYNVSFHTFITGDERIRCLNNCGFEVWNKPEWSFKWQFATKMLKHTTNRPSASERVPTPIAVKGPLNDCVVFFDSDDGLGDVNPIKGREKATPMPDESGNDIIIL